MLDDGVLIHSAVLDGLNQTLQSPVTTAHTRGELLHVGHVVVAGLVIDHGPVKPLALLAQRHVRR